MHLVFKGRRGLLLRGFVGSLLRATSGFYLAYVSGIFNALISSLWLGLEVVGAANSFSSLVSGLWSVADSSLNVLHASVFEVAVAIVVWVIGGRLIDSSWSVLLTLWPGWVKLVFRVVNVLFNVFFILAILYSFKILSLLSGHVDVLDRLNLVRYITFLYILPLASPLLRAVITFRYSHSGRARRGVLLLVVGGLIYIFVMYMAYAIFSPLRGVISDLKGLSVEGVGLNSVREIALKGLEALIVLVERLEIAVWALTISSIAYTGGFLLFEAEGRD